MAWGWRATFQYHLSLLKAQIQCSHALLLAKKVLVSAKRNDLECQLSLALKVYLSVSDRIVKHFDVYPNCNTGFLFNLLLSQLSLKWWFFLIWILQWLYRLPRALFNFALWGKSVVWNWKKILTQRVPRFPPLSPAALLYYCWCVPAADNVHLPFSSYITWSPRNSMKAI